MINIKCKNIEFALNDHFYDFVDDWNYKFYFLVGGYGSSKSYHVAVKLIKKLLKEKRKALVVREVFDTIRDSCYDLLQEVSEAMGVSDYMTFTSSPMQVRFKNGSRIIFKGMDKPAKLKSLNGVSIVWIEECSEVKYAGFKEILGRLRHPTLSNHIILSTNPVNKSNWCYKYFFQDKKNQVFVLDDEKLYRERILVIGNTYYHHSTVDDNYFVPYNIKVNKDGTISALNAVNTAADNAARARKITFSVGVNIGSSVNSALQNVKAGLAGSYFNGLDNVPYDGFRAVLHKGERVLTAEENKSYSSGRDLTDYGAIKKIVRSELNNIVIELNDREMGRAYSRYAAERR